ncbi:MAG: YccF domain-containing protein [Anaerolineales bacterium]|nr:YccF domain-containing protein [Anaerolineales bacterium]
MTITEAGRAGNFTYSQARGPGCLLQAAWFIFVGWWLGALTVALAWLLNLTIIGLPLGMALLNNIPRILSLRGPTQEIRAVSTSDGRTFFSASSRPQYNFFLRAAFFLLIGWWWSALWLIAGYLLAATFILLPVSLWMFGLLPMMTTLRQY